MLSPFNIGGWYDLWRVVGLSGKKARCRQPINPGKYGEEKTEEFPVAELVLVVSFGEPIYPVLTPVDRIARGGPDKPWHVLINADNYHALQLLLYGYERKVDVIYIDPPYNTRDKDWKYNNDYVDKTDISRHSKWLSMMKKRLVLAKRLLNPLDAVLIVTIDEKEYLRLGLLLEQVFPEAKIQMVSAMINPAGVTRPGAFARTDEYIFFVFIGNASATPVPLGDEWRINPEDKRTTKILWSMLVRTGTNARRSDRPNLFYPFFVTADGSAIHSLGESPALGVKRQDIKAPLGTVAVWPIRSDGSEGNWQASPPSLWKSYQEGFVRLGKFTDKGMSISYLKSGEQKKVRSGVYKVIGKRPDGSVIVANPEAAKRIIPTTAWRVGAHDASRHGSNLLKALIPGREFPFPKSLYAVEDTLRFFVDHKPKALVLDFFGGSGTTTHAVARLNKQDGGKRQSILVTNNEVSADDAASLHEKGLRPGDAGWEELGIFEQVTRPRLVSAFTGKTPDGQPITGDYKFADEFPMADGFEENVEFFRLDFVDPSQVERGDAFEGIVPILWMMAGAMGERESRRGASAWYLATHSPFAVLLRETKFSEFEEKLRERKDIHHVFLVTDSDDNFALMRRELGRKYKCVQLYKSYLDNFRVNTVDPYAAGKETR